MTYQQTLDYLYDTLPMFTRIGNAAFKKDLDNIRALCDALGNPQQHFKSIHVGGTNGKGSVSHMLAAVLQKSAYKTGLYTSPHLYDFRERMKVNGSEASAAFVQHFVAQHKALIESIQPSFFEITVAMAFQFFKEEGVDVAVVEVGLGGRLDSTNIIQPDLSIITNISWDHMAMLGNTLQEIAGEKAGIIKEKTPIVIGEKEAATVTVFQTVAQQKGAPLFIASENFSVEKFEPHLQGATITIQEKRHGVLKKFELDLPGIYQIKNLCTVLQSIALLKSLGYNIDDEKTASALAQTKALTGLYGRWDVLQAAPGVVLEVAHNEAGIRQMLAHVQLLQHHNLHFVLGFVNDKDISKALSLFPDDAFYYFSNAHIPRALPAADLKAQAATYGLNGAAFDDVNAALQAALAVASPQDIIVVCGSIFLVAEVDRSGFSIV